MVDDKEERTFFGRKKKSKRGYPSGADPSVLCKETILTETDILHVKDLPSFDNRISQRDSELLMSYLTVPYLRIPLVLSFFASQEHIVALLSPTVQALLDAVLFEPGMNTG